MSKFIGVIYPGLETIKLIEKGKNMDPFDFRQWLTYWSLFAITTTLDDYDETIMIALPLYHFGKTILLVWAFHP